MCKFARVVEGDKQDAGSTEAGEVTGPITHK
jgi:hypothetical protein